MNNMRYIVKTIAEVTHGNTDISWLYGSGIHSKGNACSMGQDEKHEEFRKILNSLYGKLLKGKNLCKSQEENQEKQ